MQKKRLWQWSKENAWCCGGEQRKERCVGGGCSSAWEIGSESGGGAAEKKRVRERKQGFLPAPLFKGQRENQGGVVGCGLTAPTISVTRAVTAKIVSPNHGTQRTMVRCGGANRSRGYRGGAH
jgi:hypothetical protein